MLASVPRPSEGGTVMLEPKVMKRAEKRPHRSVTLRALAIRINRKLLPRGKALFKARGVETGPGTFFLRTIGGEYRREFVDGALRVTDVEYVDILDLADKLGVLADGEDVPEVRPRPESSSPG